LEAGIRAGFIGAVEWPEFHVISLLGHSLMGIGNVGSAVISHDVGVPACSGGRVVYRTPFVPQKSALVVLVNHYLILFTFAIIFIAFSLFKLLLTKVKWIFMNINKTMGFFT
jgi:hypothetical protein